MTESSLRNYSDVNGNVIVCDKDNVNVKVIFNGKGNRLEVKGANFSKSKIHFTGNNARVIFEKNSVKKPHQISIRVGEDSRVIISSGLTIEKNAALFACEGASIIIGRDCMFASNVQIRADDSHPIFDVRTGERINKSKDIVIGDHCWLGFNSVCLKGAKIGSGSVVAMNSVVTKKFPNNVLLVGSPSRIVRTNIAWERPNLATTLPPYKLNIRDIKKTDEFWNETAGVTDLKSLYEAANYNSIIKASDKEEELTHEALYYRAMALCKVEKFKDALRCFMKCRQRGGGENIDLLIANTAFRNRAFSISRLYFRSAYIRDPFNLNLCKSLIICGILLSDDKDVSNLLADLNIVVDNGKVEKMLKEVVAYLNHIKRHDEALKIMKYFSKK